jgi:predicted histone-like DNA-binding protein
LISLLTIKFFIMSVKFKVVSRRNPLDGTAPVKFYAAAIADGEIDLERLAELIAYQCTVTEADCYAVLLSLEHNTISELEQGRIVRLGRLGSFQIGLSSDGRETEDEVTAASIVKNRILFRPGKKLRNMLATLAYRKEGAPPTP